MFLIDSYNALDLLSTEREEEEEEMKQNYRASHTYLEMWAQNNVQKFHNCSLHCFFSPLATQLI